MAKSVWEFYAYKINQVHFNLLADLVQPPAAAAEAPETTAHDAFQEFSCRFTSCPLTLSTRNDACLPIGTTLVPLRPFLPFPSVLLPFGRSLDICSRPLAPNMQNDPTVRALPTNS